MLDVSMNWCILIYYCVGCLPSTVYSGRSQCNCWKFKPWHYKTRGTYVLLVWKSLLWTCLHIHCASKLQTILPCSELATIKSKAYWKYMCKMWLLMVKEWQMQNFIQYIIYCISNALVTQTKKLCSKYLWRNSVHNPYKVTFIPFPKGFSQHPNNLSS